MTQEKLTRFKNLTFEDFKQLARDPSLSRYEMIGFPDSYRQGQEGKIFEDIKNKLTNLSQKRQIVVDIGPGCSDLPRMIIDCCRENEHTLILIDSAEMLAYLPDEAFITKVPARYPTECEWLFEKYAKRVDAILTYSVFQYVYAESNPFDFVDGSLSLLNDGGEMLIGDIPNISTRKRFFSSPNGIRYHQEFTKTNSSPEVEYNKLDEKAIDDAVVLAVVMRCRLAGFHAFVVPQMAELPMANRREDILIRRP